MLLGIDPLVYWGCVSALVCLEFAKPVIMRRMMRGYERKVLSVVKGPEPKALSVVKGSEPKALSASTGCVLTDEIFAAAKRADLDPYEEIGSPALGSQD